MTTWDLRWIGCGDKKNDIAPAIDLYLGSLFSDNRRIVEHTGSPVDHILSAEHVVLPASQITTTYNNRLPRNPRSAKSRAWGAKVISFFKSLPKLPSCVLVLAGAPYIDCWIKDAEALSIEVDDPLRGMGTGDRRSFTKRFIAETPKAPSEPREVLLAFLDFFKRKAASLQTGLARWADCFYRTADGTVEVEVIEVDKKTPIADILRMAHEEGLPELFEIQVDEGIWSMEWAGAEGTPIFRTWEDMDAADVMGMQLEEAARAIASI